MATDPSQPAALPPRLVITQIYGGLGNQLFQYAAGRSLAQNEGAALWMDLGLFQHYPLRQYLLDRYPIQGIPASAAMLAEAGERSWWGWKGRLMKALGPLLPARPVPQYLEGEHRFRALALPPGGRVHLKGYWQSEKYFGGMAAQLRKEFSPLQGPKGENAAVLKRIRAAGRRAVSVHVRRGDYASDARTLAFHGLCGVDYYQAALRRIRRAVPKAALFVFSDDPAWAKANLRLGAGARFLSHNPPERPWEDLRLMAACSHFVIANSSFSWWGAWLGTQKGKRVVAPRRWFAGAGFDPPDLIPASWERI
jgi:hypothetical protein